MLLTIDIGNSSIKAAIFEKNKLVQHFREKDPPKLISIIKYHSFKNAVVCSVVPKLTEQVSAKIKDEFNITSFILTKDIKFNLDINYKTPETLGIDRLCSAEGAFFLFKNSNNFRIYNEDTYILAIDFGTATTTNIIEYPGKFIGGLITPGVEMMFDSLNKKTAQLPDVDISDFDSFIGNSTDSSIASGVVTSAIGMFEKTINYLKKEKSAKDVFIYITGGNAKKIIPHLNFEFIYEEALVLYGVSALWKLNNK
ncbi:type III pantothenate kinase [bacterium BMS3Abin03]|nr:type III pantothenate kinase [bacterium BMS3Abin03]MCG6961176.1 type III pantothenate kinase [bacterium BMS3Abin03]